MNAFLPDWFTALNPVVQALLAGCFTWGVTALGASLVFFTRRVNRKLLDGMMGFAAGVMIAASFWSLLVPSIDMAEEHAPSRLLQRHAFVVERFELSGIDLDVNLLAPMETPA